MQLTNIRQAYDQEIAITKNRERSFMFRLLSSAFFREYQY